MLNFLMTYGSVYSSGSSDAVAGVIFLVYLVYFLIMMAVCLFFVICQWKIFSKAGRPGWAAIIPIYNAWVLADIVFGKGWVGLILMFAGFIPVIGSILVIVLAAYMTIRLAAVFGKGIGFGIASIFFPVITYPILAFGSAQYDPNEVNFLGN